MKNEYAQELMVYYDKIKPINSLFNKPDYLSIDYPKSLSEAEIAAKLWKCLRKKGFDARLEVSSLGGKNLYTGKKQVVNLFDIVVFSEKTAFCVIEVKKKSIKNGKIKVLHFERDKKQLEKYAQYGLDVFLCVGEEMIGQTLENVYRLAKDLFSPMGIKP